MRVFILLFVVVFLSSCGVNKARIADTASGPKELYVNLQNDPLLISIELRQALETLGYVIAMSSEEAGMSAVVDSDTGKHIYHNITAVPYRYELILAYQPIQERVQLIAASVRDRQQNKVLGTYRWSWSQLAPAPTIDDAIVMIDQELLSKVFP